MAYTLILTLIIFSSFLLPNAHRLQPNQPGNLIVKWIPSSSNDLRFPDSYSSSFKGIFSSFLLPHAHLVIKWIPSNHLTQSATDRKAVLSHAPLLQPNQPENQVVEWNPSSSSNHLIEDDFHFHSHCHHHQEEEEEEEKERKNGFLFDFRFRFAFHFHSHCHHHEKEEMKKQFDRRIAGEEIPNGNDMIKAKTEGFVDGKRVHHHKTVGDGEEMVGLEEVRKKKLHKKERKKEKEEGKKKSHKNKEKKKEKEDCEGIMRFEESKMKCYKKEKENGERIMRLDEGKMKRHKKEDARLMKKLFQKFFKH